MAIFRNIILVSFLIIINSCAKNTSEDDILEQNDDDEIINCTTTDIFITEEDNIAIPHTTNPSVWNGTYSDTTIKINFIKDIGADGETEEFAFIFDKTGNCPKIERAYKFYDGKNGDVSAITEMNVTEFYIKEWGENNVFSGILVYIDPHDKISYSRKFWVALVEENIENTNFSLFSDCYGDKLPIDLDLNNDGIIDFRMVSEKTRDIGNSPQFNIYSIKLRSTNDAANQILSPIKNNPPHAVVYEPPFTSENKRQYFNGVKSALDIFYEFDSPYESYNFFLNNNLTYKSFFENDKEDYLIISMSLNNKIYFGWIKFKFDSTNCTLEILSTFLNPIPNNPVRVN